jgi:hypothetical protein
MHTDVKYVKWKYSATEYSYSFIHVVKVQRMNNIPVQHLAGSLYNHNVHYKFYTCKVAYILTFGTEILKKQRETCKRHWSSTSTGHEHHLSHNTPHTHIYICVWRVLNISCIQKWLASGFDTRVGHLPSVLRLRTLGALKDSDNAVWE